MSQFEYVGKSVLRRDGVDKTTGRGLFTTDMFLPGMLFAKVLRSQSRRPQRGARVPASFRLGAGVFLSFTCFCDAVFCAAAQGRGRSTWGMGWRALEEPKEGWVFLMGSAWPSAAGGLGCRRQVSEALCQ